MENENYMTIKELSEKYNVKYNSIATFVSRGRIPFLKRNSEISKGKGGSKYHDVIVINENHFKIYLLISQYVNKENSDIFEALEFKNKK